MNFLSRLSSFVSPQPRVEKPANPSIVFGRAVRTRVAQLTALSAVAVATLTACEPEPEPQVCDASQLTTYYLDTDEDGYTDSSSAVQACTEPKGYIPADDSLGEDCDDEEASVNPGAKEGVKYDDLDCDGVKGVSDEDSGSQFYYDGTTAESGDILVDASENVRDAYAIGLGEINTGDNAKVYEVEDTSAVFTGPFSVALALTTMETDEDGDMSFLQKGLANQADTHFGRLSDGRIQLGYSVQTAEGIKSVEWVCNRFTAPNGGADAIVVSYTPGQTPNCFVDSLNFGMSLREGADPALSALPPITYNTNANLFGAESATGVQYQQIFHGVVPEFVYLNRALSDQEASDLSASLGWPR